MSFNPNIYGIWLLQAETSDPDYIIYVTNDRPSRPIADLILALVWNEEIICQFTNGCVLNHSCKGRSIYNDLFVFYFSSNAALFLP